MTPRDRRAVVLGASAVGIALLLLRGEPWAVAAMGRLQSRAVESAATANRARDLVGRAPAVRDSLAQVLSGVVALAPKLVSGRSSAEAQATLAGLLNFAAGHNALKVVAIDALPDSAAGVFAETRAHAVLEGDIRGLVGVLRTVETGDPILTVTSLSISAPDPRSPRGAPEILNLELLVTGYYLPKGTP